MEILTSPKDSIINIIKNTANKVESDFYLRLLILKNNSMSPIGIDSITFKIMSLGKSIKEITYREEALSIRVKSAIEELGFYRENIMFQCIGMEKFWDDSSTATSTTIESGKQFIINGEHFKILSDTEVDELEIEIKYRENIIEKVLNHKIPVVEYKNKNEYIFPVKGVWMATDIYSTVDSHRWCYNSEFAFDLGQLDNNLLFISKDYMDNVDFTHYGKEIIAIADGEVVDCFAGFPEHSLGYPNKMTKEEYDKLEEKYGPIARICGNYVVIKHLHDEYSLYCHMIPASLRVNKGDIVKQGQVIGRLGNSGNSICPHLHFHLMDGKNIMNARGLPCSFTNIKSVFNQYVDFPEEDGMIIIAE